MTERLTADISRDLRASAQDMRAEHRNTDAVLLTEAADKLDGLIALLAQAETERDALLHRAFVAEDKLDLALVNRAEVIDARDRLAETIRQYEPVIEAAKAWLVYGWNTSARLTAAIEALWDTPSTTASPTATTTAPEASLPWPGLPTPGLHLVTPEDASHCLRCGKFAGPWTCPAPVDPEETTDA